MSKTLKRIKASGISSVTVSNYKSVCQEQTIDLKPLTLLAGTNSSGKSSIMQPLLLLKQTLEAPFDPGPLLLDGPNVRFTSTEQLFCKVETASCDAFTVKFQFNSSSLELKYNRNPSPGVAVGIESMTFIEKGKSNIIRLGMASDEIEKILPKHLKEFKEQIASIDKKEARWETLRDRCFLNFNLRLADGPKGVFAFSGVSPASVLIPYIERIIHVPGLRGNPARTYGTTAVEQNFPGTFEKYCASIINHWQATKDSRLKEIGKALEILGLTWKVEAKPVDDTQVEIKVGRLPHSARGGARDMVSIADVGFGVSQTLPVIVALLAAEPGQLVYIEQPEIHLHPKAQKHMARLLAEAAGRGVIVIVETHSSLLLRGIQTLVANNSIPSSLVKLHWFTRENKTGATIVSSSDMDENGAFGNWPEDFDDVTLEAESEYLDAVESRGAKA